MQVYTRLHNYITTHATQCGPEERTTCTSCIYIYVARPYIHAGTRIHYITQRTQHMPHSVDLRKELHVHHVYVARPYIHAGTRIHYITCKATYTTHATQCGPEERTTCTSCICCKAIHTCRYTYTLYYMQSNVHNTHYPVWT